MRELLNFGAYVGFVQSTLVQAQVSFYQWLNIEKLIRVRIVNRFKPDKANIKKLSDFVLFSTINADKSILILPICR
jgi:hypothetical protein